MHGESCVKRGSNASQLEYQKISSERTGIMPRELSIVEQKIAELWMNDAFREQMIAEAANDHEYEEEEE